MRETLLDARMRALACRACPLRDGATQVVFGDGTPIAKTMLIGEAPGADEDRLGKPFVGRAGQLLDTLIARLGWRRGLDIYITNVAKCRPPGNRAPTPAEAAACRVHLDAEIRLVRPERILLMGATAARELVGWTGTLGRAREHEFLINGIPARVTYHPAYILRQHGEARRKAEEAFLEDARKLLEATSIG